MRALLTKRMQVSEYDQPWWSELDVNQPTTAMGLESQIRRMAVDKSLPNCLTGHLDN